MKKLHLFSTAVILFSLLLVSSCKKEEPTPSTPADPRDQYVGSWTCNETSQLNGSTSFTIHINKSGSNSAQVLIENFYNLGFSNTAAVTVNSTSLTIPQQTYSGNQISGSGTLTSSTTISLTYTVFDGSNTDHCTASCVKQ